MFGCWLVLLLGCWGVVWLAETDVLWEQHCKKFLQEDIVIPVLPTTTSYPLYDKWDNSEGPPPTSWKSLYIAQELQQLADRQDGGQVPDVYKTSIDSLLILSSLWLCDVFQMHVYMKCMWV